MADDSCADLRDVAIVGGGCYGTFYVEQLEKARAKGAVRYRRLLVVDRDPACRAAGLPAAAGRALVVRDWDDFFDDFLGDPARAAGDAIVPSPLMPHLMVAWLVRRARARWPGRPVALTAFPGALGTPYESVAPDGTRYVSFADWLCPVHCIEPHRCPVTRAPRTWEMGDALAAQAERLGASGVTLFTCRHRAHGVGMFDVAEVLAGDAAVAAAGAAAEAAVLVGTISSCHGAVSMLRLGAGAG